MMKNIYIVTFCHAIFVYNTKHAGNKTFLIGVAGNEWSAKKQIRTAGACAVMAKCRIGHFVEAQILEAIEIDYIAESEVLSPADDKYHIDKTRFQVPFVCGARDLGEALRELPKARP